MKRRVVIDDDGDAAAFTIGLTEDEIRRVEDEALEEGERIERLVAGWDPNKPTDQEWQAAVDRLRERDERLYEETIATALDGPAEIPPTRIPGASTGSYDDELLADPEERTWALSIDERRGLGVPGLVARTRRTDRKAGRPRASTGLAHDETAIRGVLAEHATRADMTLEEFVAPFPPGQPTAETRARREALSAAVGELRAAGATVEAIGRLIGRAPARVSELNPKRIQRP